MRSCAGCVLGVAVIVALAPWPAWATPTGLNNIPIADVVSQNVLVWQGFSVFGQEAAPAWCVGLKYGPAEDWEVGLDDTVGGVGSAGAPTLQAKHRLPLGKRAALALGVANISDDRDRCGELFPYAVVSADLTSVNGHLGYTWQKDNHAWFLGLDRRLKEELTLRADWTQARGGEESVASLGFIRALDPRWLAEGWVSFPTAKDEGTSYVVKLNYVVSLLGT